MTLALRQRPLARVVAGIVRAADGAIFDASDLSTLYQDAAGTTPVTAVEQPVGLMLDKSRGLMLGPELVSNGDFSNGLTGWQLSAGATALVTNYELELSGNGGDYPNVFTILNCEIGSTYQVTLTSRRGTAIYPPGVTANGTQLNVQTTTEYISSKFIGYFTANVGLIYLRMFIAGLAATGTVYFDDISVKKLYGYHATQPITASRPTLSARYNLFTGTDSFSGWTTGNTTIVAGLLTATSTNTDGYLRYPTSQILNTRYSSSIEAKQGTTKWLRLRNLAINNNVNGEAWFDLSAGVLGTVLGAVTASIINAGDGYFRCSITGSTIGTISANYIDYSPADADNTRSVTGGKTLYVRNPIHSLGDLFLPYQRVNTATDYDTDERYFKKYLQFSSLVAIDDYLNLTFMNLYGGGSASIVCARDAVSQTTDTYIISERSTTDADPKYFPSRQLANAGNMDTYITDDAGAVVLDTVGSPFSGVANAVIRSIVDSGNNLKLFKNGVLAANDNYTRSGTLTLNNTTIGASVSTTTSNYASMKLYGLIVTKSALTDSQRIACERYLGRKSGVQL